MRGASVYVPGSRENKGNMGKCSQYDDARYSMRALRVYNDKCD